LKALIGNKSAKAPSKSLECTALARRKKRYYFILFYARLVISIFAGIFMKGEAQQQQKQKSHIFINTT